jgi:hypothetical protein
LRDLPSGPVTPDHRGRRYGLAARSNSRHAVTLR